MKVCTVHLTHRPRALRLDVHHILPLAMGGTDALDNRVNVCPTGHVNIHRLMSLLIKGLPLGRLGTHRERQLARHGYDAWVARGKPGRPVYALEEDA